jgi:hypothetical protein
MLKNIKWLGLVLVLGSLGYFCYQAGANKVQTDWDASTITELEDKARREAEYRKKEKDWQDQIEKERYDATQRENALRADSASAHAANDGLRLQTVDLARRLAAADPGSASTHAATALGELLTSCSARRTELAESCDRHVNDLKTLMGSWPTTGRGGQ